MTIRRDVLCVVATAFMFALPVSRTRGDSDPTWAAAFVRRIGNEIVGLVTASDPPGAREQRLQSFIDRVVDVEGTARFCLGRFWRQATAAQQQDYVALFHAVLVRAVLSRINSVPQGHNDVHVTVDRAEAHADSIYVPTTVQRSGSPPFRVTWVISDDPNNPRIIDVLAEGTSLRITVRSDYYSFLDRHGDNINALLEALRRQACETCAPPTGPVGQ
jgi:phospholipid transport system substrate-binding protein